MCFWLVKAFVSKLTAQFSCWVLHASLQIVLPYSPLFVAHFVTCHRLLTSQRFSSHQLSLLVSFFPVSKHISQCLHDLHTFPSHLPQLNLSIWQTSTLELHIFLFLMPLTYSFGIQMSTGRIKWKEAWKVNSPISAPIIGNVFTELQLSGVHRMSCGL